MDNSKHSAAESTVLYPEQKQQLSNISSSLPGFILFVWKPQLDLPDYNSPRLVEAPLYNHSIARVLQQYLRLLTTGKATNGITTKGTTTIKKQHSIAQPHL